ncbi:zinc-binding dehydrogenase [Shewanella benthica]|uniref:Uncharacterized protein n=1 Tax=Shewanella benthica KT99 TaxID=314608 RepID=A9EI52_9GAMM|nr:hypothetical protein KT99_14139 [Shewanella benthica KT99]
MVEEGKIESIVDKIYPIEQAVEAHRRIETEHGWSLLYHLGESHEI